MANDSLHDGAIVIATMAARLRGLMLPCSAADKVADRSQMVLTARRSSETVWADDARLGPRSRETRRETQETRKKRNAAQRAPLL